MMTGLRPFTWSLMAVLLSGCAVVEGAVGLVEKVRSNPQLETIGLGINEPCDTNRSEARRIAGAYLQTISGTPGGTTFSVTGKARKPTTAPLPQNIAIDDSVLRSIAADENGLLKGWRRSTALPIAALNTRQTLPLAYTLSYRAEGNDFTGPLVVGIPPLQETVPKLGLASYAGAVTLSYTAVDASGTSAVTEAVGNFTMQVGYGSGRAEFRAGDFSVTSGPALPFARLRWTRLGLCGARLVSTGQGVVSLYDAAGTRIPTLGPGADPTAGVLLFESSQFAPGANADGPIAVGGVFAVQGDAVSLTGAFLSRSPP